MTTLKLWKMRVTGHVQGVYYRATTKHKAQELGLTGFVRNEKDGSVYIEVQGPEEDLQLLYQWCLEGPPGSDVERIDLVEARPVNVHMSFEIQ